MHISDVSLSPSAGGVGGTVAGDTEGGDTGAAGGEGGGDTVGSGMCARGGMSDAIPVVGNVGRVDAGGGDSAFWMLDEGLLQVLAFFLLKPRMRRVLHLGV